MKKTMKAALVGVGAVLLAVCGTATADVVPREGWRMLNGTNALALAGEQVSVAGFDAAAWMPAKVPGTVLDNLVRNGKLPEPYWGLNNRKADGLIPDLGDGNRTYYTAWFRTEFDLPADWKGRGIWLRPEGINYRAEIWLNGKMVAFPSGMFACQTVDVSLFANPGARNALAVKVYPLDIPGDTRQWRTKGMMEYANGGDGLIGRNVTMLMSIGWDFTFRDGIRDRNTGIWKDMVFFATGDVRLDAPFVRTKLSDDLKSAELDISVEAINSNCDRWLFRGNAKGTLEIEVEGTPLRFRQDVTLHRGERREIHFKGTLDNPRLWWPVNKGRPELYTLVCRARTKHGEQVVRRRFGVREAYSDQSGKDGARQFWINKRRIFIRGTNWIPEAMLRTDDARMEAELRLTRQQGVNMVRLWGGGIVESDRFYDLCDEMGLLVWQEFFMTGDTAHPDDAALYLSCVSDQVKRIRHHASICHYVCSNESTEVDGIRELLERLDGTRSYMMQSECDGVHDGSPYFSLNPMRYYDDTASPRGSRVYGFNPEYGTAVLPTAECLREVLPAKDLWPINREAWAYRDGNNFYKSVTVHDDLVKCYGEATSLDDYCRRSQALDYHATRAIWEVWNRVRNEKGTGVLYWYNNVPLPKVVAYGWDYSLEPTPALFATQNALEPLHAQYDYLDDMVCLANDLTEARSVEVSAAVYDFESRKVWEKSAPVTVPAERCVEAFKIEFPPLDKPHFIHLSVREVGREIASTFYWRSSEKYEPKTPDALTGPCTAGFAALSELPKTTLSVTTAEEGNTMRVTVKNTGDRIAFLTRLALTGDDGRPLRPSFYSDNWFSLLPGEVKTVTVQHPARPCRMSVSAWNAAPWRNSSVGTASIALRHATLSAAVEDAHSNIVARFIGPEGLLRDYEGETPTPADCRDCRPNAMGWWSPIENGPMFTGPYLEAVCARASRTGAAEDRALAKKLAEGLVRAASVSDVKGMIVRGFGTDGVCHYPLGSEDQTIPWFYGLYAYWRSGIPSAAEKASVAAKVREVADALESNGWKCPCDGAFTGQTRGAFMDNGLVFRGAAHTLFLLRAVWEMTGEDKWLRHYDEALKRRQKATTLTMLEVCREGWVTDVKKFNADGGGMWIYVCAQGCLARLAEMDPAHADDFRAGLAQNAARARPAMASVTFSNVIERPFKYANWRTGYRWRPQKTQKDADDVQRTGDPAILGHRKKYERKTMTLPLSAAAVCAFAGAAREDVDRTLRSYDYSQINLCEFFLAEVAAERMFKSVPAGAQPPPAFVTQEDAFEETCDGAFWHVQGIAISDDAVYCGLLKNIVKFDLTTGKCLKGVPAPHHTGDVCWHNGRLYTSVLANFGAALKNPSEGRGVVQVYDADLNLIRAREFPMGFDGIAALDGVLYLGRGVAGEGISRRCRIVRVKEETLEFIDEVEIEPGFEFRSAVQDIATDGRHLFFSFYPVKGPVGVAVYTKDLQLVTTLPETFSNGFDRLPGRFQRPGSPTLFGVLRSFTRKDAQGLAVPGYSAYLQTFAWDGKVLRDVTPSSALALRDRPSRWLNLFNGKDLSGWTPKIRGYKAGENPGNTFRVVNGCLCNRYDDPMYADGFKQRFGHLFYNRPFSNYVLRATYRMPLPQVKGGEGWANYNNGIMLHGQTPESMGIDQSFPVSIEYQLLSRARKGQARSTANLCTPGTNVEKDGNLYTPHVLNSTSRTCEPDAWTTVEAEVRGGERIIHRVDGQTVLEYEKPQYDPRDGSAKKLIQAAGGDLILRGGTISIQSESAPTDFKSILVRPLARDSER